MNKKYDSLFRYIEEGHFEEVYCLLLLEDLDVNFQDDEGITALMYAVTFERNDIVELLLQHGADPNIQDYEGFSSLIMASYFGNLSITRILLCYGANPFICDNEGNNAISMAILCGHPWIGLFLGRMRCVQRIFLRLEKLYYMSI